MGIGRIRALLGAACLTIAVSIAAAASAQTCDGIFAVPAEAPAITDAYNETYATADPTAGTADTGARKTIQLGNTVTIKGDNLTQMFTAACEKRQVVLYLNGWQMKGLTPAPPSNPNDGVVHFTLKRSSEDADAWTRILGSPLSQTGSVQVSMGFKDGFALPSRDPSATLLKFTIVPMNRFLLWLVFFFGMVAIFGYYACFTNIIRDPGPTVARSLGVFSLSRMQGAWWFFVIVACYLFIGTITQDFSDSINSTALILLGIGAGTVIGAAAIDAQADPDTEKAKTDDAIKTLQDKIKAANTAIVASNTALKAAPPPASREQIALRLKLSAQRTQKKRLLKQLGMQKGESQGVLTDILSDADGISFHRFQMAAFTVILSIVFCFGVYETLTMPTFNSTLMGMLGLSAGTYLGLKIPEAKTPTQ